jgi:acyl-CoA synthetase (AMP-forming)/AMP-acid ligase II
MTGDIGMLDDQGRLVLRGRERDEINKGGMKVFPSDIDAVVERFDRTNDVCTFAFEDPIYGQNVGIAVVLEDRSDETIKALYAWMKSHLAESKMPMRWWVIDAIPRTSRGKINRDAVRDACQNLPQLDLPAILGKSAGS